MKVKKFFYILLILLILLKKSHAFKIVEPFDNYKFFETENFKFYYPLRLKEQAKYLAGISESAYEKITKTLMIKSYEKTHIVLLDYSDITDGLSTNLPYNKIYLNITQPELLSTIGEFENYLINLFIHEYLHILIMDEQNGYSRITRKIFGKPAIPMENPSAFPFFILIAPPNIFLPKWFHEGLTTFGEGYFTGKGRGNFTLIDSTIRVAVNDNVIPRIDELNGDLGRYPYGHTPYWWGQKIFEYLEKNGGLIKIGQLVKEHASYFPYFINDAVYQHYGLDYLTIYNKAIENEVERQKGNIKILTESKLTPIETISYPYESINSFAFSEDDSYLALDAFDPHSGSRLVVYDLKNNKKIIDIKKLSSCGSLIFSNDNKKLFFTQLIFKDISKIQQDIFELNLENKTAKKLTKNMRIKDLSFLTKEGKIIGVKKDGIIENIVMLEDDKNVRYLTDYKESFLLSNPAVSKDGEKVLFTKKDLTGIYSLNILDLKNKTITEIYKTKETIAFPAFFDDNKKILFITDKTGVFNLAEISLETKETKILTNFFNGILRYKIKDGFIYFTYPTKTGYGLGKTGTNNLLPQNPPEIKKIAYPFHEIPERLEIKIEEKDYSPYETLIPRFFLPNLVYDHEGSVIGIFTANQDILGKHTYFIEWDYGIKSLNSYYKLSYVNESFYPTLKLLSYSQPILYYKFYRIADFWEKEKILDLSLSFNIPLPKSPKLSFGIRAENKSALSPTFNKTFFGIPIFEGERNSIYLALKYGKFTSTPLSMGPESGSEIEVKFNKYLTLLNSDISGYEIFLSMSKYFNLSEFYKHKTLFTSLKMGYSKETKTAQNAFSLGGIPSLTNPFSLRGYPQNFEVGKYISTLTLEYKYPLSYIFKGPGTKPFFLEKLYNIIFYDAGNVWDEDKSFKINNLRNGIGTELRADFTIGYWAKVTPLLGIAKGLNKDGAVMVYFNILTNF